MINTRNGLFANQGYGGGVFNGNTAFGSYSPDNPVGIDSYDPISGLGALAQNREIPAPCWDKPGFKDCHAVAWGEASNKCSYCAQNPDDSDNCGGFTTIEDCINRETNAMAWANCVATFCPAQDPGMKDVSLNFTPYKKGDGCSSANTIKNVQFVSGTATDGKWGPNSQAAYETLVRVQGTTYCDLVPGCTGTTPIGGSCGTSAVVPPSAPAPAPLPVFDDEEDEEPIPGGGTSTANMGMIVAGVLALAVGAALVMSKPKRRK